MAANKQTTSSSTMNLKVTEGTSDAYYEQAATAMSHALWDNPVWRIWIPASDEDRISKYYAMIKDYLVNSPEGTVVTEAEEFSACSAWLPPGPHSALKIPDELDVSESAVADREAHRVFTEQVGSKFGQNFYRLIILARDPRRAYVPGAVRAVLQPLIDRADAENAAIWLSTTNGHAKDLYLHFGFNVLATIDFKDYETWSMARFPAGDTDRKSQAT